MPTALDAEYNRLIEQLSELNRQISDYRKRGLSATRHSWHEELEEILEPHRMVTARLREIAELRAAEPG